MPELSTNFAGITAPNPLWLASAPPTDKAYNVQRALEAGWGGVVWKTVGEDPPIVNVNGPRYGYMHGNDRRLLGFNNIELITDRPLAVNLREVAEVKKNWPERALLVSVMVPMNEKSWADIAARIEDAGADGMELNLGCPHGMSERGMGSAVGQVPEYVGQVVDWCKKHSRLPVVVKLTPNVTDIRQPARAAMQAGADAVSLINTINSIMRVDYDTLNIWPAVDNKGTHGGYCGPAVKPIALHMVAEIARDPATRDLPLSGIGGVESWRDAVDFLALGARTVQVCTAAMTYGFRVVEDMLQGLENFLQEKNLHSVNDIVGAAVPSLTDWKHLNLNYVEKAWIDQNKCIQCGRCYIACEDTSHQAITREVNGRRHFEVIDDECVGCNLCAGVCPVDGCISMRKVAGDAAHADWTTHPNNPARIDA